MYGTIGRAQRLQELVEREWGAACGGGQPVSDTRVALVRGAPAGAAPRVAHGATAADVRGGRGRDILTNHRLPAALHKALVRIPYSHPQKVSRGPIGHPP